MNKVSGPHKAGLSLILQRSHLLVKIYFCLLILRILYGGEFIQIIYGKVLGTYSFREKSGFWCILLLKSKIELKLFTRLFLTTIISRYQRKINFLRAIYEPSKLPEARVLYELLSPSLRT